jgi:nicotinamidase-related amidase
LNKGTLENWRHICVDMQRLFAEDTPWHVVWMDRVLPQVLEIASAYPERTIFTRFLTPETKDAAKGSWRDYYEKWWMMTGKHLPAEMLELVPALQRWCRLHSYSIRKSIPHGSTEGSIWLCEAKQSKHSLLPAAKPMSA